MEKSIINELIQIVGEDNIITSLEERTTYSYDSSVSTSLPDVVVFPLSTEHVSAIVKIAAAHKIPLYTRGAGSGSSGGSVPTAGGISMVMTKMDKIIEINKKDFYVITQPGVINERLKLAVEAEGLFYPPDPGSQKYCTIGGNIAVNSGGPRAFKYGITRDYVLELEVVLANGDVIHTGSKTTKNSFGYDLTRLMIGAEGTLGVITQATLRLVPIPADIRTALVSYDDLEDAGRTVSTIISKGIKPTTLELMDKVIIQCIEKVKHFGLPTVGALLLIEVDGMTAQVDEEIKIIRQICMECGATDVQVSTSVSERNLLWKARNCVGAATSLRPTKLCEDPTVPPSQVPAIIKAFKAIAEKYNLVMPIFGHAGDGNLHTVIMTDEKDKEEMARAEKATMELFETAIACGGTLSGEHGVGGIKAPFLNMKVGDTGVRAMQAIKNALDPQHILNPNKVILF